MFPGLLSKINVTVEIRTPTSRVTSLIFFNRSRPPPRDSRPRGCRTSPLADRGGKPMGGRVAERARLSGALQGLSAKPIRSVWLKSRGNLFSRRCFTLAYHRTVRTWRSEVATHFGWSDYTSWSHFAKAKAASDAAPLLSCGATFAGPRSTEPWAMPVH